MDDRVRRALLAVFAFGSLGTGAELVLLGHTEKAAQWVPLVLLALGLLVLIWLTAAGSRAAVRAFQGLMLLFAAAGLAGLFFHYQGNVEFERERNPDKKGFALFAAAMTGATPALAPGTMVLLGSIGLLYAYRHPAGGERP